MANSEQYPDDESLGDEPLGEEPLGEEPLGEELLGDMDEAQLVWLLTSAHGAADMRPEFARSLSARLDADFAAAVQSPLERMLAPSTNGHHQAAPANMEVSTVKRDRSWWRRGVGIGAAASLILALAVWSNPPAWANVIRAIVQSIEQFTLGGDGKDDPTAAVVADASAEADQPARPEPAHESVAIVDEIHVVAPPTRAEPPQKTEGDPRVAAAVVPRAPTKPAWSPFQEPLAQGELTKRVDDELAAQWAKQGIQPVGPATDAEFMRRVYLDLTGRVPSVSEARDFLEDQSPSRREQLVDRVLAHHDHATHFAVVWREILLPDGVDLNRYGGSAKFDEWLAERFEANEPYDELVRELLLAEGRVSESGPLLFYAAVRLNPEELAARTSRAFLGVRMECAQCHDHPFDDKISQQDFWSLAAFFARISRPRGKMEMTSPVLQVRDNARGDVMIPESDEVVPPRLPESVSDLADDPNGPSRRVELVAWLTSPTNEHFSQATVNRVWAHLFGRGIVEPVDDMRPANPPICPEVLDTLSRDFAASGFDLRRLCRALVLTDAYQLSSAAADSDPARTLVFAQMNIKSFTAEQLYDCIAVATRQASLVGGPSDQAGLARFADMNRQAFIEQFRAPQGQATDYQAGIPQALTMMHGGLIHNATDVGRSGLLNSLAAPFFTDEQRLDTLYLSTLSRYPEPAERDVMLGQIASAKNVTERQQVLGDVLWALLNSAEFTLNH
jgi:hypothetical protein